MSDVDPLSLDLATLSWLAGSAANELLLSTIQKGGHPRLRISHGYVFQMLISGPKTIGTLAEQLGVTQQAASKVVGELTRYGYLTSVICEDDRRLRQVGLSKLGNEAVETARSARTELEGRLLSSLDSHTMASARRALACLLDAAGGLEAARRRRVRYPKLE
ncbi:MarR family winged helix-turn-helix transcriptional regulator [Devosia ginsengisoli]|uniref:Winged helix DNA-binding protein n=1 Tax=Devosia ginsengisoli TaxID=400770 RepID=A0A5B8LS68_9HYPH|nr:MarR family transcriptional regulator [Devosia ginsengisoli]QDZ10494.1 winged helix DNA-binding protein [Devosia ginsengisoli]